MNIAIVGKSCYTTIVSSKELTTTLAGHTMAFTRQLIPFLISHKHQVALVSPCETAPEDSIVHERNCLIPKNLKIVPFTAIQFPKVPTHDSSLSLLASMSELIEEWGNIDHILCVYCFPFLPILETLKKYFNYKIVAFLRGGDGYKFLDYNFLRKQSGADNRARYIVDFYRYSLNQAEFVFCVSKWLRSRVETLGVEVDDIIPSPALVEETEVCYENCRNKKSFAQLLRNSCTYGRLDPEKKWLTTSGRLSIDKRLDLAIKAFSRWNNKNWQLVITGAGPIATSLIKLIRGYDEDKICLVLVPPQRMATMFRLADAYIHTAIASSSFIDSRPSSVTSAAFYGKAVIFPQCKEGGVAESLSRSDTQCLGFRVFQDDADTVEEIANKLRLLEDKKLIMSIEKANRSFASSFNPGNIFRRVETYLIRGNRN